MDLVPSAPSHRAATVSILSHPATVPYLPMDHQNMQLHLTVFNQERLRDHPDPQHSGSVPDGPENAGLESRLRDQYSPLVQEE